MNFRASEIPLLHLDAPDAPIAWRDGVPVSRRMFLAHVKAVAAGLPEHRYAINLCGNIYEFMVGFCASLLRGQTNLLPPSHKRNVVHEISRAYPDHYCLAEAPLDDIALEQHLITPAPRADAHGDPHPPALPAGHVAAIVFTSGSTGQARPNPKTWHSLAGGAPLFLSRFGMEGRSGVTIVATVPPQHMYGLETSVMVPLMSGLSVCGSRPFYAEDIRATLAGLEGESLLITTPFHLRICAESGLDWPRASLIISATAPLYPDLAAQIESLFQVRLHEIYGCTEVGSMASRRTLDGDEWRLYDGLSLSEDEGTFYLASPLDPEPVELQDSLELLDATGFKLLGRDTDIVKVAGKRYSLAELNRKLNQIDGVEDGVFLMPEEEDGRETRLAAFAVAPGLDAEQIIAALKQWLDPVFLPRPLHLVERLPRNETGKPPREELLGLLRRMGGRPGGQAGQGR